MEKKCEYVLFRISDGEELYRNNDINEVIREGAKYRSSDTTIEIEFKTKNTDS